MIKLSITQATCRVSKTADEHITAGMVGKVVHVDFADDWSDLVKVAVCSGSGATKDVVGWTDRFVIPSEVCKNAGSVLKIGIYGYRTLDEEVTFATPTVVANLGAIEPSLSPSGDTTTEASAEVWQQILNVAESKLADAPKDGKQYLRKDGSWEELGPDEETASRIEAIEAKEASWDSKAAGDHNHAGVYQPVGDYANSNHTHSYNNLTDKPTIPEAYNDTALKNRVAAIEAKESTWNGKQDAISDLATIRAGAAAGATALQELPEHTHADEEITMSDFDVNLREFAQSALSGVNDLSDAVAGLGGAVSDMNTVLGSKLSDAPSDGKQYARQSGAWAEVQGGGGGGGENIVQLVDWVSDGTVASKKFDVDVRGYKALIACAYISPLTAADANTFLRLKLADVDAWYSGELLFYNKQTAGTYNLYSNGAIVLIDNDIAMTRLSWFGSQYNTTGFQPSTMNGFAIGANTRLYVEWYNRTVGNIPSGYKVSVFGIK